MTLLKFNDVSLAYGSVPLLDHVSWQLCRGERVCLIGRNGAGKSSLLGLVRGAQQPDDGSIWRAPALRIAQLPQELPAADGRSVYEVVAAGLSEVGELVSRYHKLSQALHSDADLQALMEVQQALEARDGWALQQRVDAIITRLGLPAEQPLDALSGGWQRRVLLAQALVAEPDVLLLDEPTNHLDVAAIYWLEETLKGYPGAVLFITHDRAFLQALATRILELDRGHLIDWDGDYASFLEHKAQQLAAEETANALFDKRLAQEEVWIRQGIKARRTRNEGRVRALEAMRRERSQRREQQGRASFQVDVAEDSGKQVVVAQGVGFAHAGQRQLLRDFDLVLQRGDRIGLLGANGSGKTTLLRLLLGELEPTAGRITLGTRLEVVYFDQVRGQLDAEKSILDNLSEGREFITINGQSRHVISYLGDFLFSPERTRTPVKALSGGERARLLLAKLFSQPANVLVLDEPTNDLDMDTLDLLESLLLEFPGTVLLVSHDRSFLDRVVTSTLVFEGDGQVREYVGGYQDWLRQGGRPERLVATQARDAAKPAAAEPSSPRPPEPQAPVQKRKLSYKEQRELEALPQRLEAAEAEIEQLQAQIADPALYQGDPAAAQTVLQRLNTAQAELDQLLERWTELES